MSPSDSPTGLDDGPRAASPGELEWLYAGMDLPICPLCGNPDYEREEERTDTRWGFSTHIKVLLICTQCRYVLTFYDKNSIFDFD